jgi:Gamma-glutamyltranspeptidase
MSVRHLYRRLSLSISALITGRAAVALVAPPAEATRPAPPKDAVAIGTGGAVATVDPYATQVGVEVLRRGGNAVDAAVATAAALGVSEPYSAGVGGGGFFVFYDARTKKVKTIDGRETAPNGMDEDAFVENGVPIPFSEAVTSGLSVGVPGTPATWELALRLWGTTDLRKALRPATTLARKGFVVDETFRQQTADNAERFADFTSTRDLFLPGGKPPEVGTVLRNTDLARTYHELGRRGTEWLYGGRLGEEVVETVQHPPVVPGTTRNVRKGLMEMPDLSGYQALLRKPTQVSYRGLQVYGMAPPSSGGSTVGEALNILEGSPLGSLDRTEALHRYLEASALAFADRNRYVVTRHSSMCRWPSCCPRSLPTSGRASSPPPQQPSRWRRVRRTDRTRHAQPRRARRHSRPDRPVDDPSHDMGPVGQRRRLYADDRADRRFRHRRTRTRLPAQQRADRLQLHPDAGRPQPARAGEAAALVDESDHRVGREAANARPGISRRCNDYHHRAADVAQPG